MPYCAILDCKNHSRTKNLTHGSVSYHRFPDDPIYKEIWLNATGRLNWFPTRNSTICSQHFKEDDFIIKKSGNRYIKDKAEPSLNVLTRFSLPTSTAAKTSGSPDLPASISASPDMSLCRVCLALDVRMFDMKDFKLTEMFHNITGISVCNEKESILHRVCWECAARLKAAAAFRNKALLSDTLLKDLADMKKSDIAKLKHVYQNTFKSPLTIQTVFDIGCGDTNPDYKDMESLTDETEFKEDILLVDLPMKTNVGSDPLAENDSNIQIKYRKNETISALTDIKENSEVYYNNNDMVLSEDTVMTNAPINGVSYIVLVIDDQENRPKLDVISNTVNDSVSEEDTESLAEVAAANEAKTDKVGTSCEQENRLKDREKQKIIALKEKSLSVTELSEETGKSSTVQNIKTINQLNNQLTPSLSSQDLKPITQDISPPATSVAIKDENEIFVTKDITDENDDGINDPGFEDPGFDDPGINNPGFDDNGLAETVVLNDKDDPSEEVYMLSDKENYSSDDSIPAKKIKAKKPRKTTEKADKIPKRVKKIRDPKIDRRKKPIPDDLNENIFTITQLTFEEQIAEIVKRQESANYKLSYFKCTKCFKGFSDEDAYNNHMSRHTDQCGEHECKVCKMHYKHLRALKTHIAAHHAKRYSCTQCTYVTRNRSTAKLHGRWHKGTKYRCPHCPEEFAKLTTYLSHVRIKHPSDFICQLCGYSFVSALGLRQHKKMKHRLENVQIPEDGPLCELCNVRFISSEAHKRHLSVSTKHNTDTESRESNTPIKGRKSKATRELKRRARDKDAVMNERRRIYPSGTAKGPTPCEQCGLQLEDIRTYRSHFKRMHPDKPRTIYPAMKNPYMCEVCGKMFQWYCQLKNHAGIHTDERPFKCELCGKSYRTTYRLEVHQHLHSQERVTYECKVCRKHFSSYSNRGRHMLIHTGVKPHKCEICGKGFKLPGEKRAHISYVHQKKPWPKRTRGKRRDK